MEEQFDLKDRKILYELDLNSRQTFQSIGKKVGLSKNAVKYRIDNFLKSGIIKQFHTVLDLSKLGLISFRVYLNLRNLNPHKEKEIITYLEKTKIVTWIISIEGEYNLGLLVLTKSIKEMNDFWEGFNSKYVNFVDKKLITIMTRVHYFSRAFLKGLKKNDYEILFVSSPPDENEKSLFDDTDLKILEVLSGDARKSVVDISSKLGLNEKTVISRMRKLEEKKIIVGYKTVFNLDKLGYLYYKINFNFINLNSKILKEFKDYIKNHPNIIYEDEVLGGEDLEIELQVKDVNSLREIIDEIKTRFSEVIANYSTLLFYKEHKYLFFPHN